MKTHIRYLATYIKINIFSNVFTNLQFFSWNFCGLKEGFNNPLMLPPQKSDLSSFSSHLLPSWHSQLPTGWKASKHNWYITVIVIPLSKQFKNEKNYHQMMRYFNSFCKQYAYHKVDQIDLIMHKNKSMSWNQLLKLKQPSTNQHSPNTTQDWAYYHQKKHNFNKLSTMCRWRR